MLSCQSTSEEETMTPQQYEAEIAAFIGARGVTRCPTACAAPTQGSGSATDRAMLRRRNEQREEARELARQASQRNDVRYPRNLTPLHSN
jgi:hypothetical protein